MRHHFSAGSGTYRHPHLRCRVVKPRTRGSELTIPLVGYPWVCLFPAVRELRRNGYAVHSVYRVWANHWVIITTEGWESC